MGTADAVLVDAPVEGVRLLTLNRPEIRNAITEELSREFEAALEEIERDRSVRAVVITGQGTSFCAGADLSWLDREGTDRESPEDIRQHMRATYDVWLAPQRLPVPVIAAINGPAVGAGMCVALSCDLRYAATEAVFSVPFLALGTHGGMGATYLLKEAVGSLRARELLYTGRSLDAAEARDWGVINEAADPVLDHALAAAERIAAAAPIAVRLTKTGLRQAGDTLDTAIEWELLSQSVTMTTDDIHEGIAARRERRPPRFQGR